MGALIQGITKSFFNFAKWYVLCNQRLQASDVLMFMDLISYDHRKQLGNPGKQQICMECLFIPGSALCKTETVFEVIDGFFNIYTDLIGGSPFLCIPDGTRVCTEIFFRIDVDHPSAGRIRTGILTVADPPLGFVLFVVFPFHFGAYELHGL